MKISYGITVCNEFLELKKLINHLFQNKRDEDEIVVIFDEINGTKEVREYLKSIEPGLTYNPIENYKFRWYSFDFENNFSELKNCLTDMCHGDYVFQIDADEIPNKFLLKNLPQILKANPDNEVYLVPRENYVKGITQEHLDKWGWKLDEKGRNCWPDYQWRIYKNSSDIRWKNKVHEVLEGFKTYSALPSEEEFSLLHYKEISRQEKQNNYYNSL